MIVAFSCIPGLVCMPLSVRLLKVPYDRLDPESPDDGWPFIDKLEDG